MWLRELEALLVVQELRRLADDDEADEPHQLLQLLLQHHERVGRFGVPEFNRSLGDPTLVADLVGGCERSFLGHPWSGCFYVYVYVIGKALRVGLGRGDE